MQERQRSSIQGVAGRPFNESRTSHTVPQDSHLGNVRLPSDARGISTDTRISVSEIMAVGQWPTNGDLILDVVELGYLYKSDLVLDPTYGLGVFWRKWKPNNLVASDLDPEKSPTGQSVDFCNLPHPDGEFDAVVLDPPYKLNGTPSTPDERYGVDVVRSWQDRHRLIRDGITEGVRVLRSGGVLLLKCQDQVCSGKVRWQTIEFANHAASCGGMTLEDVFMPTGHRPQPGGRRQLHARRNYSSLMVFQKP